MASVQEAIDLLINLKGKEQAKDLREELEKIESSLKGIGKDSDEAAAHLDEMGKKAAEAGSKFGDALGKIAQDAVDPATGLPSVTKAVASANTALDSLIDATPLLAAALGAPMLAGPLQGLTGNLKGLKDALFDWIKEASMDDATREEAQRMKELADSTSDAAKAAKELADQEERRAKQIAQAKDATEKQAPDFERQQGGRIGQAINQVGGPQAAADVAAAFNAIKGGVNTLEKSAGGATPRTQAMRAENLATAQVTIQRAQGAIGTQEEQEAARRQLGMLFTENQTFRQSGFGRVLSGGTEQEKQAVEAQQAAAREEDRKREEADDARRRKIVQDAKAAEDERIRASVQMHHEEDRFERQKQQDQERQDKEDEAERMKSLRESGANQRRARLKDEAESKDVVQSRPDLVLGVRQQLAAGGWNDPNVRAQTAKGLVSEGVDQGAADQIVGEQSASLRAEFQTALHVTGDVNAANLHIQQRLAANQEEIMQRFDPMVRAQRELEQRLEQLRQSLQKNGR